MESNSKVVIALIVIFILFVASIILTAGKDKDEYVEFIIVTKEIDKTICDDKGQKIYETDSATYYANCDFSYYIVVEDKDEYTVSDALSKEIIDISDLLTKKMELFKYEK